MLYLSEGAADRIIGPDLTRQLVDRFLEQIGAPERVLLLPPDFTRYHSGAGEITVLLYQALCDRAHVEIMPATGTHYPVSADERERMFPGIPAKAFRDHDWRNDVVRLGEIPGETVSELSEGRVDFSIPCEVNRTLVEGNWDRIISIGQLVPHEVAGIANHTKNVLVGAGGPDTIARSHFLGAAWGMERLMGRAENPVRRVLDLMTERFLGHLPIVYLMTVREMVRNPAAGGAEAAGMITRGLYAGDDAECYRRGAALCVRCNLTLLERPIERAVVYLDPTEFKSTWLGNKAIYRLRMAMADGGELTILAPGVNGFGEDKQIDAVIRRHGYRGTPEILRRTRTEQDLADNLGAAAHLIHGSTEGRFEVVYCPGGLDREEIEGVGYRYGDIDENLRHYPLDRMHEGANRMPDGQEVFFVPNPGVGLWALNSQFAETETR